MRGTDIHQEGLLSYLSPETRIPRKHPLRPVREMVNAALAELSGQFEAILAQAEDKGLTSDEHFTVDGTLIEVWASMKSARPKDGSGDPPPGGGRNPGRDFHGEKRKNETHGSTTDSGKETRLCYLGYALMETRNGLVVDARPTEANGIAERDSALEMVAERPGTHRVTVGADKLYDTHGFVSDLRELKATPHVAQSDTNRRSAIDGRTTCHTGYAVSQRVRKRVEEIFGWSKTVGPIRKTKFRARTTSAFRCY